MENILTEIEKYGIIPILTLEQPGHAADVADALIKGGLPVAEVTLRTKTALKSIEAISKSCPDMILGAGTVLAIDQAKEAVDAGAKFLVTPGMNKKVLEYCVSRSILVTPGCSSPTDIELAMEFGLNIVKVFPIEPLGGLPMLKSIAGPYVKMRYIPTGGISEENIAGYIRFNKVVACGGSFMVKPEWIALGEFGKITDAVKKAVSVMLGFEFAHIGINMPCGKDAFALSDRFERYFGFTQKIGNSSIFAGPHIEIRKEIGEGSNGHIAVKTNSVLRAAEYLKRMGLKTNDSSVKKSAEGDILAVYLTDEFGGYAIHLLQK